MANASFDKMLSQMVTEQLKSVKTEIRKEYQSEMESLRSEVSSLTKHVETLEESITQLKLQLDQVIATSKQQKKENTELSSTIAGGSRTAEVELRSFEIGSGGRRSNANKTSTLFEKEKRRNKRGVSAAEPSRGTKPIHESRTSDLHFEELTSDALAVRVPRAKSTASEPGKQKPSKPLPPNKHRRKVSGTAMLLKDHMRKRSNSATPAQILADKKKLQIKAKAGSVQIGSAPSSRRGGVSKARKKKPNWPLPNRPGTTPTGSNTGATKGFISSVASSKSVVQSIIKVKVGNRYLLLDDRYGICRYWDGKTIGLELEIGVGDTDGTMKSGKKCFSCAANKGIFIKKSQIAMDCGKPT